MSKASDFAGELLKAIQAAPEPFTLPNECDDQLTVAMVTSEGYLSIPGERILISGEALALADWIRDTFGEGEK